MDAITAMSQRMVAIQQTLSQLGPRTTASPAGATAFAAALATELAAVRGSTAAQGVAPATPTTPPPQVAGFSAEQVTNAAAVVQAGRGMGLSPRDQAIGVMTALGESSLRVLDRGDTAGPDSRGLFQQRDNGAWGTLAERMDPTASAQSFFRALQRVEDRDAMTPTAVAHAVQRNADPHHYTRSWDDAVRLVSALTGADPARVTGA
ncbi:MULTISPECIES: hypothetical protein [unclassified Actinotalea]|uniref:hypothetical protein n=1 Tax=unclassified Actinotalea TaxID=2638618 RepID=UPI0015F4BE63|nr:MULTISPECIES: hypothetical protein [unclassified Actinotalea]